MGPGLGEKMWGTSEIPWSIMIFPIEVAVLEHMFGETHIGNERSRQIGHSWS